MPVVPVLDRNTFPQVGIGISPLAAVDRTAELADDVSIGPFCVVGPRTKIGSGTVLVAGVTLLGSVELGQNNRLFPGCVLGTEPQDRGFEGGPCRVIVGDHCTFREGVTVNGSASHNGATRIGSGAYLMNGSHVAHDCRLEQDVTLSAGTMLGGHVEIGDQATLSGGVCVHPHTTIGRLSFVGGNTRLLQDVPPFCLVDGEPARARCVNAVGLARAGIAAALISRLVEAHRLILRGKVGLDDARSQLLAASALEPELIELIDFVQRVHRSRHGRQRDRSRLAA